MHLAPPLKVLVMAAALVVLAAQADAAQDFLQRADGSVEIAGHRFASMEAYLRSDYFRENGKRCGVRRRSGPRDEAALRSTADCTYYLTNIVGEYWQVPVLTLPVWWHVISRSDGVGEVSDARIAAQMRVLNEDYRALAGTRGRFGYDVRIQFELAGITRTVSDAWFSDTVDIKKEYTSALNVDPAKFINIYTNDAQGFLGYATLPFFGAAGQYTDGIVLLHNSVGGRDNGFGNYDQGRTLVHEMGHYLGLFHTFEDFQCGNTYGSGDLIVDTNAENAEHYGCAQSFTCGTADPIHNYMNYTDDSCMIRFTREQANRAVCSLVNYRPSLYTAAGAVAMPPLFSPLLLK